MGGPPESTRVMTYTMMRTLPGYALGMPGAAELVATAGLLEIEARGCIFDTGGGQGSALLESMG